MHCGQRMNPGDVGGLLTFPVQVKVKILVKKKKKDTNKCILNNFTSAQRNNSHCPHRTDLDSDDLTFP